VSKKLTKEKLCRGVTLVELLICLAIIAILVSITIGAMQKLINHHRIQLAQQQLLSTLDFMRTEAVMLNQPVHICPSHDQKQCNTDWNESLLIFTGDMNSPNQHIMRVVRVSEQGMLTLHFANQSEQLSFAPDGASNSATFKYCYQKNGWQIIINNTGRIYPEDRIQC
jgi:type IV fimbrial biogenesis protein FimT